jgi:hypothetical protein
MEGLVSLISSLSFLFMSAGVVFFALAILVTVLRKKSPLEGLMKIKIVSLQFNIGFNKILNNERNN